MLARFVFLPFRVAVTVRWCSQIATAFFCCLVALIMGTIFFESIKDMIIESVEGTSLHPVVRLSQLFHTQVDPLFLLHWSLMARLRWMQCSRSLQCWGSSASSPSCW